MQLRAPKWVRFVVPAAFLLLPAGAAHAQRVPEVVLWWASASLLAPFVAVPVKLGILRLLPLEVAPSRLWWISAIEWVLWFPVAFILLRYGRSSPPVIVLVVFASAVWLHRKRIVDAPLRPALILSVPTPVLAIALPFLALGLSALLDWLG